MNKIETFLMASLVLLLLFGCKKDDDVAKQNSNTTEERNTQSPIYPIASFSVSTDGLTVNVTSRSSNASALEWFWGDGRSNKLYSTTASHTYSSAGTYTIKLLVTSSTGHQNMASTNVTVKKPAPTQVKITSLKLNKFPAAPSSGSWDVAGKPDIYFTIKDGNGTVTYYTSTTKLNVSNNDCPITWYCNHTLYNVAAEYIISFWDEDDLASDEFIVGGRWTPSIESNNYSSSYHWFNTSVDLDFTIYMTWYATKGGELYTKSVDFRNCEWQTDDPEVKRVLGL